MGIEGSLFIHEPCHYLSGRESRIEYRRDTLSAGAYEVLLAQGWRRSGSCFYRCACDGCCSCIPIRLSYSSLKITDRLRRVLSRNSEITCELLPPCDNDEYFRLYEKYLGARHDSPENSDRSGFRWLLDYYACAVTEYRNRDGVLVALGFIDILPDGLSSVYFVFDPEFSRNSLGYFSVIQEARYAMLLGKKWYYLGFWVPGSKKMEYKADFSPFQIAPLSSQCWVDVADRDAALLLLSKGSTQA